MIPLNKPGHSIQVGEMVDYLALQFPNKYITYCFTAGDCLNLLYKHLYEQRGAMRIGVSPLTCYQAILPIIYNGHTPILLDIDKSTLNINTTHMEQWPEMDAIEVIHLGGNPCDMNAVMAYAESHNLMVIEDCAQALGVRSHGSLCGSFGDYAVFSTLKNIYQPGGILVSNEHISSPMGKISSVVKIYKFIKDRLEGWCNHRKYNIWNPIYKALLTYRSKESLFANTMRALPQDLCEHIQLTLPIIDELNDLRIRHYQTYLTRLHNSQIHIVENNGSANRVFLLCDKPKANDYINILRSKGIAANNLTQSYLNGYQKPIWEVPELAPFFVAEQLHNYTSIYNRIIAIPNSPYLTNDEIDYIIQTINSL